MKVFLLILVSVLLQFDNAIGQTTQNDFYINKSIGVFTAVRSVTDTSCPNEQLITPNLNSPFVRLNSGSGTHTPVAPEITLHQTAIGLEGGRVSRTVKTCDGSSYQVILTDSLPWNASRPVYFLHGLGGKVDSWKQAYLAYADSFVFESYLPAYNYDGITNQQRFLNSSKETHDAIVAKKDIFENGYTYYNLPYVIAHSQGGLISRDLDWKYNGKNSTDPGKWRQRTFYGLVTVGTPHSGAKIAISQSDLTKLGLDLGSRLTKAQVAKSLSQYQLPYPITRFISKPKLITNALRLIDTLRINLEPSINAFVSKGQADPITRQYAPNATYLVDTLNQFVNPCLSKALFYGLEQQDMIWRIATFMLKNAQEYPQFGANNDDTLHVNMEKIRVRLIAEEAQAKYNSNIALSKYRSCIRKSKYKYYRNGILLPLLCRTNFNEAVAQNKAAYTYNDAHQYLAKANMLFQEILGAVGEDVYNDSLTHWTGKISGMYLSIPAIDMNSTLFRLTAWKPHYTRYYLNYRSDATVLEHSQKAFPGCLPAHKHEMVDWNGIGNINHMQERNSEATGRALWMIYTADDNEIPEFFKLERRK